MGQLRQLDLRNYMGLNATKPVFGVSDKVRLKPVSSATENSKKIEISLVASLDMILSKQRITKALISLRGSTGWSAPLLFANPEDRFSSVKAHMQLQQPLHFTTADPLLYMYISLQWNTNLIENIQQPIDSETATKYS